MMKDANNQMTMDKLAARFAELWRVLTHDGDKLRDSQESRLLIDRVRAALDRGHAKLDALPKPELIAGTFRIEKLVHREACVQIHQVRHRDLDTNYALKTLPPEETDNAILADLLLREGRIHLSVRHENVVTAYGVLRLQDGRPALLTEWMGGGTLSQRLGRRKRLPIHDICTIMRVLLSGIQAIHAAGIVHADITPANLLFSGDDPASLKIADFSIARERGSNNARLERAIRTSSCLASPECTAHSQPDERSDLYACGRILLLLLQRCKENTTISTELTAFARQLTHDNPDCRPQSAREASALLQMISC
ncbi:serine/threonine protein kinase [Phyllobacterium phragmitis]|uniref:serine/threonine protein kinase n=1 Tax=Phyllobacterium phragmitis TaxID=2670329 RepID=UPI0038B31906